MEYLMVVVFAFFLIAPLIIIYYDQAAKLEDQTATASINRAAVQIAEAADTVYYLGAPSIRTITVDLPKNVQSVVFEQRRVTFVMSSSHGAYEQNAWSAANLSGTMRITAGPHVLVFTAEPNGSVSVSER